MGHQGITNVLKGRSELIDAMGVAWTELCNEGPSSAPFLRPEWFSVFVTNFAKQIELVTVTTNNKLRAVLPLERRLATLHGLPVRKLQAVFNLNTQRFDLIHGRDETERKDGVACKTVEPPRVKPLVVEKAEMRLVAVARDLDLVILKRECFAAFTDE